MLDLDVIWVVGCAGLVLLMQPGFMCLEAGLTRSKNSINVAIKNLIDIGISICFFWCFGYALMFGASQAGWIGGSGFLLNVESSPKLAAFFLFQMMFCGTATTIVSGALAERLKFGGYLAIASLISGIIYPLYGHWVWNGANGSGLTGWLGQLGFVDFAGSTVVHSVGGWVSLAALLVVGARRDRLSADELPRTGFNRRPARLVRKIHGSNLPFSVLGVMLLWVGWLGFNGGSTFALSAQVPAIIVHTVMAGGAGMLSAAAFGWRKHRITHAETLINGSIAGLVSITAVCHAVSTPIAVLIGAIGGVVMLLATDLVEQWGVDDGVGAIALHGASGAWGTLAVALFGDLTLLNTGLSRHQQLLVQLLGIGVALVWAFGLTYLLLKNIDRFFPLRVSAEDEDIGLNVSEHQAKTEVYDLFRVMDKQAATQDFSLRVPEEPFTEVGKIAQRYNQVMSSLQGYSQRLEALNTNLETTVAERTADLETVNAELIRANEELQRLDQLKDEFLANTSHELRTPLNGIIGLSEYLLEDREGGLSTQATVNLEMISKSGRRLYSLVSDLLDFSKVLHDTLSLRLMAAGVREIADVVLTFCEPMVGDKKLRLVNEISPHLPLVCADEDRLQQILYNLISNAIKFTVSGQITLSASARSGADSGADSVVVSVSDEGIGVAEEMRSRIFEPFEQSDGASDRSYGGLGLGLAITKKLVVLHGGEIWVDSSQGGGAQFSFTLPVYQAFSPQSASPSSVKALPPENSLFRFMPSPSSSSLAASTVRVVSAPVDLSKTVPAGTQAEILIVDDDPINLQVLDNYLSLSDYRVTQATSGSSALALLAEGYQPDLVVLDVMMPRMTGYEVTKTIRSDKTRDRLPIILLTAKSLIKDEVVGLNAGANDYLTKPVVKETLLARIDTQLMLRQESLERQQAQAERLQFATELEAKNRELLVAQASLANYNRTLEEQVEERTAVLAESQRTLATLMSNLPGMAYRCLNNRDWSTVFVSEGCQDLLGYLPEELSKVEDDGKIRFGDLIHSEDEERNWQEIQDAIAQKRSFQVVYRLRLPRLDSTKWVWEQGEAVFDASGKVQFVEGFIIDMSDRILTQQALEASNEELQGLIAQLEIAQTDLRVARDKSEAANSAKSSFLANMSHELRTPLNSIIGFTQLLERDRSLQPQQQERIRIINRSGEHLLALINNILDISKIEAGKITLNEKDFNLHALLDDVMSLFDLKTHRKGIQLLLEKEASVPQFIHADDGKIRQVLTNLIANGVKFTQQGQVKLSVRAGFDPDDEQNSEKKDEAPIEQNSENRFDQDALWLEFAVEDTGVGIADADQNQLFVPFEQADAGRSQRQGTGLGLSISQQFVALMGGEITVESTPGEGSCFRFQSRVGAATAPETLLNRQLKVVGIAPAQPEYRLLAVDDLPDNLQLLSELLTSVGFSVRQAKNGAEAVDIYRTWQPHLIWMDLLMPVMDGYEATKRIRELQKLRMHDATLAADSRQYPVIVALTASVLKEKKAEILNSGFDAYMVKPYQVVDIWAQLRQRLGVEFLYEDMPIATAESDVAGGLMSMQANELSEAWLRSLRQAASELKGKQVQQLIESLPSEHAEIARQLSRFAEAYQFNKICEWINSLLSDADLSDAN